MKLEVTRTGSRAGLYELLGRWSQFAGSLVEPVNVNAIGGEIVHIEEIARRIGLRLVGVSGIVPANGETSWRRVLRGLRPVWSAGKHLRVGGGSQTPVGVDGYNGNATAAVVRSKDPFAG